MHQGRDSERAVVWVAAAVVQGAALDGRVCRTAAIQVPNSGRCTEPASSNA